MSLQRYKFPTRAAYCNLGGANPDLASDVTNRGLLDKVITSGGCGPHPPGGGSVQEGGGGGGGIDFVTVKWFKAVVVS